MIYGFLCNSPAFIIILGLKTFGHFLFLFLCLSVVFKEQEEEMSCWEGAEGGGTKSQRHQSESELGHYFLYEDVKLDELPGPKFRSLRHLRQVNLGTFELVHSYVKRAICVNRKVKRKTKIKLLNHIVSSTFEVYSHFFGKNLMKR